jgi:peptidylprolyl isomerase
MEKMYWKNALGLLLLAVSLSGIVGCMESMKNVLPVSDEPPGADSANNNRIVASMGEVNLRHGQAINYLHSLDPDIVSRSLDTEGGLEGLVKDATLREKVVARAAKDNWQERAEIKAKIEEAMGDVLYSMYVSEKSEPPADYPDDATVETVYENSNRQQLAAGKPALKPLPEIAPLVRQQLRKKKQQANQQDYLSGLVSGNPITVDLNRLADYIKLPQEQRQQQGERLQEPVARMGNTDVSLGTALNLLGSMQPAQQRQLLNDAQQLQQHLSRLALKAFVLNEATAAKFDARPAVKNNLEQARLQVIYTTYLTAWSAPENDFPSAALVEENYQKNLEKLVVKDRYHLAKIVIANSDDSAADAVKAKKIAAAARARGADFAALARKYSQEPQTAKAGGDIGWLNTEALLPELSRVIRGNKPGAVVGPVHNRWGWQVIKILGHQPAHQQTLEEARPVLVSVLRKKRMAEKQKQIIEQLVASEPVTVDKKALQQVRQQIAG